MAWGRVFQKNGAYWTDIKANGRRKRKKIGKVLKKVAEAVLQAELGKIALNNAGIVQDEKIKLEAFAVEYLNHKKITMKPRSYQRVESILRANVLPIFGKQYIYDVTTVQIQKYVSKRLGEGVKPATTNRELSVLKNMFSTAVKWKRLNSNPCNGIGKLKEPPGRRNWLTVEQIRTLLQSCPAAPHPLKVITLMALATGMRRGEILGLRWSYVRLDQGFIYLPDTKNNTERAVPINETLRKVLEAMPEKTGFVFPGRDGNALWNFQKSWLATVTKAKLVGFRFHDLRHSYASLMVMQGVHPRVLQDLLGHKTAAMTQRYSHLAPGHLQAAAKTMDKVLLPAQIA